MYIANNYKDLASLFSSSVIRQLANSNLSNDTKDLLNTVGCSLNDTNTITEVYEGAYGVLLENYRIEYVYKNAIINKLLLSRHSLQRSTLLEELHVMDSIADLVIVNGTSTVYEIKTEYDNFIYLSKQLNSYKKVFDKIYVVISEKQLDKLRSYICSKVGIYILTNRYTLVKYRKAESFKHEWQTNEIFKIFRKKEYLEIIEKEFGVIENMPNTKVYEYCMNLFTNIETEKAHKYLVEILRKRKSDESFINQLPKSLKTIPFSVRLNKEQKSKFIEFLNTKI